MGTKGYEGASMRDMAAGAGVSVAALYYHFPSKRELLLEFLDEAWTVMLNRVERRLADADPAPLAQLDEVVSTLIASYLHDEFAQLASNVALSEYSRLDPEDRAIVTVHRERLLQRVGGIIEQGVASGVFATDEPREAARAVIQLCSSLVEPFPEMGLSMHAVIALYQRFARALANTPTSS